MQHTIQAFERDHNGIPLINQASAGSRNLFSRFINWCAEQDKSRMLWLGLAYMGLIGMALPCTLFSIIFLGGNNFALIVVAAVINVPVLALNLAAQSTKITLPALFFALLADVAVILYSVLYFVYH